MSILDLDLLDAEYVGFEGSEVAALSAKPAAGDNMVEAFRESQAAPSPRAQTPPAASPSVAPQVVYLDRPEPRPRTEELSTAGKVGLVAGGITLAAVALKWALRK